MGNRLSKIVTRTGDKGTTGMADGSRRDKSDLRVQCLGEVDELNSHIGLCASLIKHESILKCLLQIQHDLFDLGAELCQPGKHLITEDYIDYIANEAETMNDTLPPLTEFILPGGSLELSHCHIARTVCRRVERHFVELNHQESINPLSLMYLNRLSDLLFILTRYLAKETHTPEVYWKSSYSRLK